MTEPKLQRWGEPTHHSTPKVEMKERKDKKMEMESQKMHLSSVLSKTPETGLKLLKQQVLRSSYQARFGNFKQNAGKLDSIEAVVARATTSNGLEISSSSVTTSRAEEKAALGSLNNRFFLYINKVNALIARNRLLDQRVKQMEVIPTTSRRTYEEYDSQLHQLQQDYEQAVISKTEDEIKLQNCYRQLDYFTKKLEREVEDRKLAEKEAIFLRKNIDQATLARVELEGCAESLREEMDIIKMQYEKDIRALTNQLSTISISDVVVVGSQPIDLSESLHNLRHLHKLMTEKNKFDVDHFYKSKIADLTKQLQDKIYLNKNKGSEIMEIKRQYLSLLPELARLQHSNSSLVDHLENTEKRYYKEIHNYQKAVTEIQQKLQDAQQKAQQQFADYDKLLNVKCTLEREIQTYRNLLDSEENSMNKLHTTESNPNDSVHNIKSPSAEELQKSDRSYNMQKRYYTFFPTDIGSDKDEKCEEIQSPQESPFCNFRDKASVLSDSKSLIDNELIDMLSEVVEDTTGSRSFDTWSIEPVEVEPLDEDIRTPK